MTSETKAAVGLHRIKRIEGGVRPAIPLVKKAMGGIERMFVSGATLEGAKNLVEVRRLLDTGKHIIIVPNHLSNSDGPALDTVFTRNGFSDLAKKFVFLAGLRMEEHFTTRTLQRFARTISVWPPTMKPEAVEEIAERNRMISDPLTPARYALNQGDILVLYLEGGRSRTGALKHAYAGASRYFDLVDDTFVLPIGVSGTDIMLPVGSKWPKRGPIAAKCGIPIDIKALQESLPNDISYGKSRQHLVDLVMGKVADLLPDRLKGYYAVPR